MIRPLLRGEEVTFHGELVTVEGARVEDVLAGEGAMATAAQMPLYLGVTGRPALELAGELADGVLMNICLPTSTSVALKGLIERGAKKAGAVARQPRLGMAVPSPRDETGNAGRTAHDGSSPSTCRCSRTSRRRPASRSSSGRGARAFHAEGIEAAAVVPDDVVDRSPQPGRRTSAARRTRRVPPGRRRPPRAHRRRGGARRRRRRARPRGSKRRKVCPEKRLKRSSNR